MRMRRLSGIFFALSAIGFIVGLVSILFVGPTDSGWIAASFGILLTVALALLVAAPLSRHLRLAIALWALGQAVSGVYGYLAQLDAFRRVEATDAVAIIVSITAIPTIVAVFIPPRPGGQVLWFLPTLGLVTILWQGAGVLWFNNPVSTVASIVTVPLILVGGILLIFDRSPLDAAKADQGAAASPQAPA